MVAATVIGASAVGACAPASQDASPRGETRTVVDAEGTQVEVPVEPERVVALSEATVDGLLALDITPVGISAGRGQQGAAPYLADKAEGIPIVGKVGDPNFEAVGAAKPDLIVVDGTSINNNPPLLEQLRQIAPVVYTGFSGSDWRKNLDFLAEAVNKRSEADQLVADYDARVAELKEKLAPKYADKTFSVVRWQGNGASLILKELAPGRALTDLGLRRPPQQDRNGPGHSEPVSNENLADIDADFMFFGSLGGASVGNPDAGGAADAGASEQAIESARQVPGFNELKAVREGNVIPVDGAAWTSAGGPLQTMRILDDIEAALQDR